MNVLGRLADTEISSHPVKQENRMKNKRVIIKVKFLTLHRK